MSWYPKKIAFHPEGTPSTIQFLKSHYARESKFVYAEFGVYEGATALAIAEFFPNAKLFLFDFEDNISRIRYKFNHFNSRVTFLGNSEKYLDSYNWSLSKLIQSDPDLRFDYVFIDGAHTFAIDALTFFMCKSILNVGAYLDFDDYDWRILGSSLDPAKVPEIGLQYSQEQIDDFQVARIVNQFVRTDKDFFEVVEEKVFRYLVKNIHVSTETTMSEEEIQCLLKYLSKSRVYLEFGSGHSTLLASQFKGLKVISLKTDQTYIQYLKLEIEKRGSQAQIDFVHLDIGPVAEWGWPIDTQNTSRFANYILGTINQAHNKTLIPDLILIDGRFRIASFLACCLTSPGAVILFDDYLDRDNYHIVERFFSPKFQVGRIGVFQIPRRLQRRKLLKMLDSLAKFSYDPS